MDIVQIMVIGSVIILGTLMFGFLYTLFKIMKDTFKEDDIKTLKKENKDLQKSVDYLYEAYQDIGRKYFDLKDKADTITEYISKANKQDKERVKSFENMYRNCDDEFYKKSYRKTIAVSNNLIQERLRILHMLE